MSYLINIDLATIFLASCMRLLTVPNGTPLAVAISAME